jgi:hypothetical protein
MYLHSLHSAVTYWATQQQLHSTVTNLLQSANEHIVCSAACCSTVCSIWTSEHAGIQRRLLGIIVLCCCIKL